MDTVHTNGQSSLVSPGGASDSTHRVTQDPGGRSRGCQPVLRCCCLKDRLNPFLGRTRLKSIDQGWKTCRLGEGSWVCSLAEWTTSVSTVHTALESASPGAVGASPPSAVAAAFPPCSGKKGVGSRTPRASPRSLGWHLPSLLALVLNRPKTVSSSWLFKQGKLTASCRHRCQTQALVCCQHLSREFCSRLFTRDFRRAALNPSLSYLRGLKMQIYKTDSVTHFSACVWSRVLRTDSAL